MLNKINYIVILGFVILTGFVINLYLKQPKVGYIVIEEVFNSFELKKELQSKYENTQKTRQQIIDSIRIELTLLAKKAEAKDISKEQLDMFERKKYDYNLKLKTFSEDNAQLTKQYDSEIITQLNQYVKDYGKLNHYDVILGNNSNGSLMYGNENLNLTKEVIEYINAKYKGLK